MKSLDEQALRALGALDLAHVGDAVYELLVRTHLASGAPMRLGDRHRAAVSFVSAPAQAAALAALLPHLTAEERELARRGRNTRVHGCPQGCTIAEYHAATALEALFGYLWLRGDAARAEELFQIILEEREYGA